MTIQAQNFLNYGNDLNVLRRYIKDETVDLFFLAPLNSCVAYKVHFAEKDEITGSHTDKGIIA